MLPDGSPAAWLAADQEERALGLGCRLLQPADVLALHVALATRERAAALFDLQRAGELVASVGVTHPTSAAALEASGADLATVRDVGRLLLAEGIGLADRVSFVEGLAQAARDHRTAETIAEAVRPTLSRTITRLVAPDGTAEVVTLAAELDDELLEAERRAGEGPVTLAPERAASWHRLLRSLGHRFSTPRRPVVVLCGALSRRALGQLVRESGAEVRAVRVEELSPLTSLRTIHRVQGGELLVLSALTAPGE
jgi:flagellar biosynthesis protein FlhA